MSSGSFLIANQSVGLEKDLIPFLLPEEAYTDLENAFIYRGRTPKKFGALSLGPLSLIPTAVYPVAAVGALVAGSNMFTVSALIAGMNGIVPGSLFLMLAPGGEVMTDNGNGSMSISGTNPVQAFVNYATTVVNIIVPVGSPLIGSSVSITIVHTFPATRTPCMGIWYRQLPEQNFEQTVFFDQKQAYVYSAGGFQILGPPTTWNGSNSDFFWAVNARNPLLGNAALANNNFFFVTNFNNGVTPDPIRYIASAGVWVNFAPPINATDTMYQARCIVPFKNRLLFFNTWEGSTAGGQGGAKNYPNRLRYSWIGDPTDVVNGYLETPPGKGGFVDAAIAEQIVSVAVLKDCVLVKFETVSWRIVYTGNPFYPFEWQKINQEFGSDSTFSSIQFDDFVLTVGNRAITQDSSIGVKRIDEKIPDEVFEISNFNDGPKRVWGIRDFKQELVYWTIPYPTPSNPGTTLVYPNRMICFSYRTGAFSFFKDSYTAMGRFQNETFYTWGDYPYTWGTSPDLWGSAGDEFGFENIAAGNQQGNIFLLQKKVENDPAYEISNIVIGGDGIATVTIPDHNLDDGDFVQFKNVNGLSAPQVPQIFVVASGVNDYDIVDLPTTASNLESVLPGEILPGTVVITLLQLVPPLTVKFYDLGDGTLLPDTAGFSGSVSYEDRTISLIFPSAVPAFPNVTTLIVNYNYSYFNGRIFTVENRSPNTFTLAGVGVQDQIIHTYFPLGLPAFVFGQLAYLTNFSIGTKQFNPFSAQDASVNMNYADLYIDGTEDGRIAMQIYTDDLTTNSNTPQYTTTLAQWEISTVPRGTPVPRFWTRVFVNSRGEFIQIYLYIGNREMMEGRSFYPFTLHGLLPKFNPSGRLVRAKYP